MSSTASQTVMPLTLKGNYEIFQARVLSKLKGAPLTNTEVESVFYIGAAVALSILTRTSQMEATPEEGAQIINRLEEEILRQTFTHLAQALRDGKT